METPAQEQTTNTNNAPANVEMETSMFLYCSPSERIAYLSREIWNFSADDDELYVM